MIYRMKKISFHIPFNFRLPLFAPFFLCVALLWASCKKEYTTSHEFVEYTETFFLTGNNPLINDPNGTSRATAKLWLMTNNELYYDVYFTVLEAPNVPTNLQIVAGQMASPGEVILLLESHTFSNTNSAQGKVELTAQQKERILAKNFHVVCQSNGRPNGLVAANATSN